MLSSELMVTVHYDDNHPNQMKLNSCVDIASLYLTINWSQSLRAPITCHIAMMAALFCLQWSDLFAHSNTAHNPPSSYIFSKTSHDTDCSHIFKFLSTPSDANTISMQLEKYIRIITQITFHNMFVVLTENSDWNSTSNTTTDR